MFERIFAVFSREPANRAGTNVKPLTSEFRGRLLLFCREMFPEGGYHVDNLGRFWSEIHTMLQHRHGRPVLYIERQSSSPVEDVLSFLQTCSDDHFLDFVEYIFRVDMFVQSARDDTEVVAYINRLFLMDDLPYALLEMVRSETRGWQHGYEYTSSQITSYPKVIRRENQLIHAAAIDPAVNLLRKPQFASANREFREALDDYRTGDFRDCLVKCGSSFESVLKVICDEKSWPYNQRDTAQALLNNVLPRTDLDPFFNQPLMLIATIRNRLSTAHGAGTQTSDVPRHVAEYAINATASAILLVYEATA